MVLFVNNKAIFSHHLSDKWLNMKRTSFTLLTLISTILTLGACHSKTTIKESPKDAPLPSVAEQPNLEVGQCHLHTDCKPDEVCQLKSQTCQKNARKIRSVRIPIRLMENSVDLMVVVLLRFSKPSGKQLNHLKRLRFLGMGNTIRVILEDLPGLSKFFGGTNQLEQNLRIKKNSRRVQIRKLRIRTALLESITSKFWELMTVGDLTIAK